MASISQEIEVAVDQPGITWRQDVTLAEPLLRFPLDETHFCPQIYLMYGYSAGVTLYWTAVSGATFYVVQVGDNQAFSGPDVNGIKTTNTQLELDYLKNLRVGDQVFWRVAAYNSTGGCSVMSEVRSIKITCPNMRGISYDAETGLYSDIESPQACDNLGVDIQLLGPKTVRKSDSDRTFVLNINYDCESLQGQAITINSVIWEIRQSSASPITTVSSSDQYLKIDVDSDKEEWFEVVAHVLFKSGSNTFECNKHIKVLIEGSSAGGTEVIHFEVLAACPGLDASIGNRCPCVQAVIRRVPCVSAFKKGDFITVWDIDSCYFNIPLSVLIGRRGTAILMLVGEDDNGQVNCSGYGAIRPGECFWAVESLCCAEEEVYTA